jgi:serine-type D-Ala-D-Ala carboxypeptidase/endopeptidase
VFEIGSITKAFTALILAEMVERGEVALGDPVARFMPAAVSMPQRGGRKITLVDLATHTSGLPRWPSDIAPPEGSRADWSNPYADYSVERLYSFLSGYRLRRDIPADYLYSNLGMGLLGHALALRMNVDYETLLRERVTGALGMANTAIDLSPALAARFAVGHDQLRRPVANWEMPTFAGAGALRSTANDLLTFLAAQLAFVGTPLQAAMSAQLEPRRRSDTTDLQSLGWRIRPRESGEIVWHAGATGGYRCFLMFDRERRVGVTVLTNTALDRNDDIAFHLIGGSPLSPMPPQHEAIHVPAATLERYVGRYQFSASRNILISREEDRLFAQLTGQWRFEVFPQSPTEFFWRVAEATATFEIGPDGRVMGLVLHQNGRDLPAQRTA